MRDAWHEDVNKQFVDYYKKKEHEQDGKFSYFFHCYQGTTEKQVPLYTSRLLHASNTFASNIDLYINQKKMVSSLSFLSITSDFVVPRKFHVAITKAMHPQKIIWQTEVEFMNRGSYTLVFTEQNQFPYLAAFLDDRVPVMKRVKLRLIHLASNVSPLHVATDHVVLFANVSSLNARFLTLPPCEVALQFRKTTKEKAYYRVPTIRFQAEKTYTLFTMGYWKREPTFRFLLLEDG